MHQIISLGLSFTAAIFFNLKAIAIASSVGNWGEALGRLLFAPVVFFFLAHTIIYGLVRAVRGKPKLASYAETKLNYIAAALTILGVMGSAASRI